MEFKACLAITMAASLVALGGCSTTASTTTADSPKQAAGLGPLSPEAKRDLAEGYDDTLRRLYQTTPSSRELVSKAAGVLVFPRAVSAGLGIGGELGQGELRTHGRHAGYYRTASGSIGLQIGMQSKALVFLFMTQDALNKFTNSQGWSVGADASVALLKVGANGEIDVNIARAPTIAFVMTNAGLMANLTLEGTKVTRIQ
jgi:lipid-binding SYLF domain-containing protein